MKNIYNCRVCGLYIEDAPWGEDESSPTYEICPCCGVEFGNEDYTIESTKMYRESWIKNGSMWFDPNKKPKTWDLGIQMNYIPEKFK